MRFDREQGIKTWKAKAQEQSWQVLAGMGYCAMLQYIVSLSLMKASE